VEQESGVGNWYDYGARWFDASIARWNAVDPLAEKYYPFSGYNYVLNDPIKSIDPMGDTVRIVGADGTYDWIPGQEYNGDDNFIAQAVLALNTLTQNTSTTEFSFFTKNKEQVSGNAVLDYTGEGSLATQTIKIQQGQVNEHVNGTVYWNPNEGIRTKSLTQGDLGSIPPMVTLLHEMGHGWLEHTFGNEQVSNLFYNEEQMIIDRLESKASLSLGFGRRDNHFNIYSNESEARKENLIDDSRLPLQLRRNTIFKFFYQTVSPISTKKKQ